MNFLEMLKEKGVEVPKELWDYRIYGISQLDDEPELIVNLTEGEKSRGKTRRWVVKFQVTEVKEEPLK